MPSEPTLLVTGARDRAGVAVDILAAGDRIAAIGAGLAETAPADTARLDAAGRIALPGLIEAHTHLDKNALGRPWHRNEAGPTRADRIANEKRLKVALGIDARVQAERQLAKVLALGTTHVRSHVDVDPVVVLRSIEGVMAAREAFRGRVDVEIVVFPQSGALVCPGVPEMMADALRLGADVVGGIDPATIERDPKGHLDLVFGLAERFGKPVDIHLHELDELGAFCLELMIERTRALGLRGKVLASHAYCLGALPEARLGPLLDGLADAGIAIMTAGPSGRPAPPVKRLVAAGIKVCGGTDGIRGFFEPYGSGDMLERVALIGARNGLTRDDDLEMAADFVMEMAAEAIGLSDYGLKPGAPADCVLVEAETLVQAVIEQPKQRIVLKGGRVVARDGALVS